MYKADLPASKVAISELAFQNKKCQELLESESDEVKMEVEKAQNATSGLKVEGGKMCSADNVREAELKTLQV